ncbi:MAG: phosphoenolpyruvate carboxylase [Chitinophagaceae bacterium]|nr:phosphoenolpyruvate carboxylase [Chitinophagaceae bacterium]
MTHTSSGSLEQFKNLVGIKFQLYNSLFTALPFHRIEKTGILLSLLLMHCEEGFSKGKSPAEIIESFFCKHTPYQQLRDQLDLLFRFVQYVERQVVLFDALEDASFKDVNDMQGPGTLKHLIQEADRKKMLPKLLEKLNRYQVRLVLTAHPTQFYPGAVLGIINDLAKAIQQDNASLINLYLQQLGKTPFLKRQRPTPYDEAVSLIWYLENVFYRAAGKIVSHLRKELSAEGQLTHPILSLGFWPGGDRDGNPYVTADITLKVAQALRGAILKCYYLDVRKLKRRLTFRKIDELMQELEQLLYNQLFLQESRQSLSADDLLQRLQVIRNILIYEHNSLFVEWVDDLIQKVQLFGLHFASLDIRQDSAVHSKVLNFYLKQNPQLRFLHLPDFKADEEDVADEALAHDTLESMRTIKAIQQCNGEAGCHRYIISQCHSAQNVMEVYQLLCLSGWEEDKMNVDIIPLFETIEDLHHAHHVMRQLYENQTYRNHLQRRNNRQTIMLGFSDGTKDGGYLMANLAIYKAKEKLSALSEQYNIEVIFFDGRGGPPARGGGKTHKFYASLGQNIANHEIQLTIQGQTISSNFGTVDAAQFNIEQLLHAGISNDLMAEPVPAFTPEEEKLLDEMGETSLKAYQSLKEHPEFMNYLLEASPLLYYSETNIASRPVRRRNNSKMELKDLRAIPYVASWSQLKQNVTGFYGVGSALEHMYQTGRWKQVKELYKRSLFFKTLLDNCEMSLSKCYFPLTAYLSEHESLGIIRKMIYEEYERTVKYILLLSEKQQLMDDYPVEQLSVRMRERIVLPLTTIQQYALIKARELRHQSAPEELRKVFEKLIVRCSFGIINAGRNSA